MTFRVSSFEFRVKTGTLAIIFAVAALTGVLMGSALSSTRNSKLETRNRFERARLVIVAWNDMARSVDQQNSLITELQENLKANPPHLVSDVRRRELYKQIIAEHERQLKDFRVMEENDR